VHLTTIMSMVYFAVQRIWSDKATAPDSEEGAVSSCEALVEPVGRTRNYCILVTHSEEGAVRFADRVVWLRDGRLAGAEGERLCGTGNSYAWP
jgi:hypothetical protein